MARILIVGGGCRGRALAGELLGAGDAVRITTRSAAGRQPIERAGAEPWVGTPDRLATMRGALDGVTVLLWALGTAVGEPRELAALDGERLRFFLTQAIDTAVRAVVYERVRIAGAASGGEEIAREVCESNAIPLAVLEAPPAPAALWVASAASAIAGLLGS